MRIEDLEEYTDIYAEAAAALAAFSCPEFDTVHNDALFDAFNGAFCLYSEEFEMWLHSFMSQVASESKGEVHLYRTRFTTGIRGQNETFFLRHADGREQAVVIGPYVPPIMFWSQKPKLYMTKVMAIQAEGRTLRKEDDV